MWLRTPETIEKVLLEAPLEPANEAVVGQVVRELADRGMRGRQEKIREEIQEGLDIVTIGQPETWELLEVYSLETISSLLQAKLREADFYLVRLACSFRPVHGDKQVDWARFSVQLKPDAVGRQPIAFDLHPLMVTQEVKRNVKVTLSPSLKFQEIEADMGGIEFGFEYTELQPIISAAGVGESQPSWDYEEAKGVRVQGGKWMHLLLKVPKKIKSVEATLDLIADVKVKGSLLSVVMRKTELAHDELSVKLVG